MGVCATDIVGVASNAAAATRTHEAIVVRMGGVLFSGMALFGNDPPPRSFLAEAQSP